MRCVERIVGLLQQVGYHQRRVRERHRDDPHRQPARWRHRGDHRAERHAAERRQRSRRTLPGKSAAIGPRQRKRSRHEHDERRARPVHQPTERERRQQRDGTKRDICERRGAHRFGGAADRNKSDYRDRRDQSPPGVVQCL